MLELITDRAASDIEYVNSLAEKWRTGMATEAEQAEYLSGDIKGAYNYVDMNRVTYACAYLADIIRSYGYDVPDMTMTEWSVVDMPSADELDAYLENVRIIRGIFSVMERTPEVPTDMDGFTYGEANDIEQILLDIEIIIQRVVDGFFRSNASSFFSGRRPFPSAKSYIGRTWEELDAMNTTWANWQVANWYLLLYGNLEAEGVVE